MFQLRSLTIRLISFILQKMFPEEAIRLFQSCKLFSGIGDIKGIVVVEAISLEIRVC